MKLKDYSLTYTASVVSLIMAASVVFGVDFDESMVTETVQAVLILAGFAGTVYGRWRKGDLKWFGARK